MLSKQENNIQNVDRDLVSIAISAAAAIASQRINNSVEHCMMKELQGELSSAFEMACKAGIATFGISNKKIKHHSTVEEHSIYLLIKLLQHDSSLLPYSGISSVSKNEQDYSYYYIPALYRLSKGLPPIKIREKTTENEMTSEMKLELIQQQGTSLLATMHAGIITSVITNFQRDRKSSMFFQMEALWQNANYLNNRKAKLFILYTVTNLFWNLLDPIDSTTGCILSIKDHAELCNKIETILTSVLDKPIVNILDMECKNFIMIVKTHVQSLKAACEENLVGEYGVNSMTNG